MIAAAIEQISEDFYNGKCDANKIENLIEQMEGDEWLALRCQYEIDFLVRVQDSMREAGPEFDPMSVLFSVGGGNGREDIPDY